ncbi:MAG: hypothetical protein NWF05_00885 [Candidatus Bathyarchaeota archaeon]|nr:hypothetical protein [Candidatus Bathyarchaeota archaeon]
MKQVEWLKKNGVNFNTLIMNDGSMSAAEFKVRCLMKHPCEWFWESNYAEALFINKVVGMAVLSVEGMKLLQQTKP